MKSPIKLEPFQPSLIFASKYKAYIRLVSIGFTFSVRLLALPSNIRPARKGLVCTNALAYFLSLSAPKKLFITLTNVMNDVKHSLMCQ